MMFGAEMEGFPPIESASPDGLVAIGGDLSIDRLLLAYSTGLFPWYEEGLPVLWWSPDPRAIIEWENFHVSRRLRRTIRQEVFEITFDKCFSRVMTCCAKARDEGTWITSEMIDSYAQLHRMGFAHSVEAWSEADLVGGIYGITIGGLFAGESMFYRKRDASKVAMVHLVSHLIERGFSLFDVQILNDHTESLGATEISRAAYLTRLQHAVKLAAHF